MPPKKIVEVMNGLYANMGRYYWMANKKTFDIMIKIPRWQQYTNFEPGTSPEKILDYLNELGLDKQALYHAKELVNSLPIIVLKETIIGKLSPVLAKHIESKEIPLFAENALSLVQWLNKSTSVNLSDIMISGYSVIRELQEGNVERAKELAGLFYLTAPERYREFAYNNPKLADEIRLKGVAENIVMSDHKVRMYFIPLTCSRITLHQKGIEHIHLLHAFYPFLASFEIISLPPWFLPPQVFKLVSDNYDKKVLHKQLKEENSFTSRLGDIWCNAIESNYSRNAVYDWFKAWYMYRIHILEILMAFYYAVESAVENDGQEVVAQISWLLKKFKLYRNDHRPILGFPVRELQTKFQIQLDAIILWTSSLHFMIMNLSGSGFYTIQESREQFKKERNLVFTGLRNMQDGFIEIAKEMKIFNDMSELEKGEREWYKRFFCASVYLLKKPRKKVTYIPKHGQDVINRYFLREKKKEIQRISILLDLFKQRKGITIICEEKKGNESISLYIDLKDVKNCFHEFVKEVLFPIVSYPSFSFNVMLLVIKNNISAFNCKINIRNTILRSAVYNLIPGIEESIEPGTELIDDIVVERI